MSDPGPSWPSCFQMAITSLKIDTPTNVHQFKGTETTNLLQLHYVSNVNLIQDQYFTSIQLTLYISEKKSQQKYLNNF